VALLLLDVLPSLLDFARRERGLPLGIKYMGMPADELVGDRLDRIGNREASLFLANLRQEHRFEEKVAKLVL